MIQWEVKRLMVGCCVRPSNTFIFQKGALCEAQCCDLAWLAMGQQASAKLTLFDLKLRLRTDFCLCLVNLIHCQHGRNCLLLAESPCQGGLALPLRHIPLHLFLPETEGWLPSFGSRQCNRASRIDTTSKLEVS